MTAREKLAALVALLPDNKIETAIQQLEPLVEKKTAPRETSYVETEVTEFIITNLPPRKARLPFPVR